jgi:anti-sigma B factor antagonist
MAVEVRQKGKVSIVDVKGKLTVGDDHIQLREAVKGLLEGGNRLFVFNLRDVPFMDSSGLGETAACKMRVSRHEGVIKLVLEEHSKVREVLKITGLDHAFEIYEDEGEALASFIK